MKLKQAAAILLLVMGATIFVALMARLPLNEVGQAIDWKAFHTVARPFDIDYNRSNIFHPPWALGLLWPLTAWPLPISRGLAALATLAAFVLSVPAHPDKWRWLAGILLLVLSIPMLQHLVDGNLEGMIVGGAVLTLYALKRTSPAWLAPGLILLSAKVQESWLLFPLIGLELWQRWPREALVKAAVYSLAWVTPFALWRGGQWLVAIGSFPYAGSPVDSSLRNTLAQIGAPDWLALIAWAAALAATVVVAWRSRHALDRRTVGLLVAAGLMLAPYAASNSIVTPLALGVIPFFQRRPRAGLVLIAPYFLPYLAFPMPDLRLAWQTVYWGLVLAVTWLVLLIDLWGKGQPEGASQNTGGYQALKEAH